MKPKYIHCGLSLLAGGMTLISTATPAPAADQKPNIVYIVADDLGWKDVGFNGCADIKTPNIDKLAATGAKLSQFYVQPMCTPTRAALMTGRYPFRYGLQTIVILSASTYGLATDEWLLPQALKDVGYKTAIIGKWHLGHADKKYWPRERGFDYQYGPLIGELDYFTHEEHGVLDWYRDDKPLREEGYTTTLLGNDAVRYINEQNATPFYLYLTFNAVHTPYQAPKEYIDRYKNIEDPTRRTYAGMVTCLDDEIGRVVDALDKKNMRDNTLIVFHSDNGGTHNALFAGVSADMSKIKIPCANGPYRDGKGTLYEGGTRVCALANWPGHIKAGSTVDGMMHAVDMYPTLAKLAEASTAKCKQPFDGMDVWQTISEGKPSPRTEMVYNVEPFRGALRDGDSKLIWRVPLPSSVELYNIPQDASEKNNLATANPDKVAELQKRIEGLAKESERPLFLIDQFKVLQKNMNAAPVLPNEDAYFEEEEP